MTTMPPNNDKDITPEVISNMSYTDFIAFIKETNRCPGGKKTVRIIAQNAFLTKESHVLEIGSNTGFTSLEIARTVKCRVEGIDINESCIREAQNILDSETKPVRNLVSFSVASAYDIPFSAEIFDLVIVGGATSFMDRKSRAVSEYKRVTKTWGFISVTQLFYATPPPTSVVKSVSSAIGVEIEPWGEERWLNVFTDREHDLELYYYKSYGLNDRPKEHIDEYVGYFIKKPHIQSLSKPVQIAIADKWQNYLAIFNRNHKYLGFFTALLRKRGSPEEPELFMSNDLI
jgi:SAM-dependent methyltransferase